MMFVAPAGLSPAGLFQPEPLPPGYDDYGFLADPIDVATGELLSIEHGFDPIDAWVITALRTKRGSGSAVLDVGRDLSAVTHISPRHESILRQELLRSLQPLIDAREIEVAEVFIEEEGDEGYHVKLRYLHVAQQQLREFSVPLGRLLLPHGGH